MTPCAEWKDRLLDFALGIPASRESHEHLSDCNTCSLALRDLRDRSKQMDWAIQTLAQAAKPSPAFRTRLLASLEARPPVWKRWPLLVSGFSTLALLTAICLVPWFKKASRPQQPELPAIAAISTWRSPTESLLRSPADGLLKSGPRLGEIYFRIDAVSAPGNIDATQKRDRRKP